MDSAPEMTAVRPGSLAGLGHRSPPTGARPVHAAPDWPPPVALILAADPRPAGPARAIPRPLRKVAGLGLLERSLLTLRAAGIEHFRVVLGADGQRIAKQIRQLPSLAGIAVGSYSVDAALIFSGAIFLILAAVTFLGKATIRR